MTVKENPVMAAKDIVRSLSSAGSAFRRCQYERCSCGQERKDCRQRWEVWQKALKKAEKRIAELEETTK